MTRISSQATFLYKRVFPFIWFGFLALFIAVTIAMALTEPRPVDEIVIFILAPMFMAAIGWGMMKFTILDLIEEVFDDGDALVIKNRSVEKRVQLSEIMNVSYNGFINPPRITLMLRQPNSLGTSIAFMPTFRLFQYSLHRTAKDLIERVDDARRIAKT